MQIKINGKTMEVSNFYEDVAPLVCKEKPGDVTVEVDDKSRVVYHVTQRSGTLFVTELENTLPDEMCPKKIAPVFLTCVIPEKNSYKFYKLEQVSPNTVRASYGRMGVQKGQLFGERSFDYPSSMFYIKLQEKLAKGYVDRSSLYLSGNKIQPQTNANKNKTVKKTTMSSELFEKLAAFAKTAVRKAEVKVPITPEIVSASKELLHSLMRTRDLKEFNDTLLELIAILQRPVRTGDGQGVKEIMANSPKDFKRIVQRETDILQAIEGSVGIVKTDSQDFVDFGIEVYEATDKQKAQVMGHLPDDLKKRVAKVYRVIPGQQQKTFNEYLKSHDIKKVIQLWHGSRNQNWMSIVRNSLCLNPDAIITGKMFGDGIYFAPSAKKSWNYTSFRGTYWAKGSDDVAYMGLYAVAYGKPYDVDTWSGSADYLKETKTAGCDCLHAHAGKSLKNDEIVFYDESAMVLNYIVEFK